MDTSGSRPPQSMRLNDSLEVFQVNPFETKYLYNEIFIDRVYDDDGLAALAADALVVDVGANIGLFAKYVLDRRPGARLLCIEPAPACFQALKLNVANESNAVALQCAIGRGNRKVSLYYYPGYTMMSTLHHDPEAAVDLILEYTRNTTNGLDPGEQDEVLRALPAVLAPRLAPEIIEVDQYRLDNLLSQYYPNLPIDFLKIDVEGAELEVLHSMGHTGRRVSRAVVEVQGVERMKTVRELLESWGLRTWTRQQSEYTGTDLFVVHADASGRTHAAPTGNFE